jgi:hypothetical protein
LAQQTWTDTVLSGVLVKDIHYTELQDAVNAWLTAYGESAYTFTNDPLASGIVSPHDTGGKDYTGSLRDAIDDLYNLAGESDTTWTTDPVTSGTIVKPVHMTEMRTAMNDLQANYCYTCDTCDTHTSCSCDSTCDSDACDQCDATCFEESCTCDNSCNSDACDTCDATCNGHSCSSCYVAAFRYPWS